MTLSTLIMIIINESKHEKTYLMPYANNKVADQPAHPRSLISTSVVRCIDSIIPVVAIQLQDSCEFL